MANRKYKSNELVIWNLWSLLPTALPEVRVWDEAFAQAWHKLLLCRSPEPI